MGPTSEELDSIKELIHFDHVYYKQDEDVVTTDVVTTDVVTTDVTSDVIMEDSLAAAVASPAEAILPFSLDCSPCPSPSTPIPVLIEDEVVVVQDDSSTVPDMDCPSPLRDSSLETTSLRATPSPSLSVETGYESALSPLSDCSLRDDGLFEGSPWEDSLTELFPSLV